MVALRLVLVAFLFSLAAGVSAQAPYLVADLNATVPTYVTSSSPDGFTQAGETIFFSATTNQYGLELWRYGADGVRLVKDIYPSSLGSSIRSIHALGDIVLFSAWDPTLGLELWRSDGTAAGTRIVKDIHPTGQSSAFGRVVSGGKLYFVADDGVHGIEPWVTDGTESGTMLLVDAAPGLASSTNFFAVLGGQVYIGSNDGLWVTDGTPAGTTLVKSGFRVRSLAAATNVLYFIGEESEHGMELWRSDGTAAGTYMVTDLRPGTASMFAGGLATAGNVAVFLGNDGIQARGLWSSDGTVAGTRYLKSFPMVNPGQPPPTLTTAGAFVFVSTIGDTAALETWRTDGSVAGTIFLAGESSCCFVEAFSRYFFVGDGKLWSTDGTSAAGTADTGVAAHSAPKLIGGKLYFAGRDLFSGAEPWVCENATAASCHQIANIGDDEPPSSSPFGLVPAGGLLYFRAKDNGYAHELWRTDGTSAGTVKLTQLGDQWNSPTLSLFTEFGGALYFKFQFGELWRSDGTMATTRLFKDFRQSYSATYLNELFDAGTHLLLNADRENRNLLWRSDGTPAGTVPVQEPVGFDRGPYDPMRFVSFAGKTYMFAGGTRDRGLWETDGTAGGTRLLVPLAVDGYTRELVVAAGTFYFAWRNEAGSELWRSNGLAAGTSMVKDIATGGASSNPENLTAVGRLLFFVATDPQLGRQLWRTDGSEAGTFLLRDLSPAADSVEPISLIAVGRTLFFVADDGVHGAELWRSDGTVEGTTMVADLVTGNGSSRPAALASADGFLWFSANDGVHGSELWRTDGTTATLVADLQPGSGSSSPSEMTRSGDLLYFAASAAAGRELWAMPLSGRPRLAIADIRITEEAEAKTARFLVTRSGDATAAVTVNFATADGSAVAGSDYVAQSGILTIQAGQTSGVVDIVLQGDGAAEDDEIFFVHLSTPSGATLERDTAVAVVADDDRRVDLKVEILQEVASSNLARVVRVRNLGPSAANDVRLRVSQSPYDDSLQAWDLLCDPAGSLTTCSIGTLAAGAETTIRLLAPSSPASGYVDPVNPPGVTVTATATALEPELFPVDNTAAALMSANGALFTGEYFTVGAMQTVRYLSESPMSALTQLTLTSTNPQQSVIVEIPQGAREATFNIVAPAQPGTTLLTLTGVDYNRRVLPTVKMMVAAVAIGTLPKLDVSIVADDWKTFAYGQPVRIGVKIAARRHDGTLPSGLVTLRNSGGAVVDQRTLDPGGSATFTLNGVLPGSYEYTVGYAGDANFNALSGAISRIFVNGWPTQTTLSIPPMVCGTADIVVYVRTTATETAPSGFVRVTAGATVVDLTLAPTGAPGESRAVLPGHRFTSDSVLASYAPTGTFDYSTDAENTLVATCAQMNLSATATSTSSVGLNWTAAAGAVRYDVMRTWNRSAWYMLGSTTSTSHVENGLEADRAYIYTVRAIDAAGNTIAYALPDLATTVIFSDDPIIPGATIVKAAHLDQIRRSVNALSLLDTSTFVTFESAPTGTPIRAVHFTELRTLLNRFRGSLGLGAINFSDPSPAAGTMIRAAHVQDIRGGVK